MRILTILLILIIGCTSTSVSSTTSPDNDVLVLALLVQDHLRKTDGRDISLTELIEKDTLKRISKSFETVYLKLKGGHISVYYKFSESRDSKGIELTDKEKELAKSFRWAEKELKNKSNGEIQFDYGERFYRLIKIIAEKRIS